MPIRAIVSDENKATFPIRSWYSFVSIWIVKLFAFQRVSYNLVQVEMDKLRVVGKFNLFLTH